MGAPSLRPSPNPPLRALVAGALACAILAAGCAVPVSHRSFSVPGVDEGAEVFASTQDLYIAGLTIEALALTKQSRLFEAESRLRQSDYLNPGNARTEFNLAVAMNQTGQHEEAMALAEKLLARKPNDPAILALLADIDFALGDHAKAKERLKAAFEQYRQARNLLKASRTARSISNLAFIDGREQEALCYSYEALALLEVPEQLGWHARLLVALNFFPEAEEVVEKKISAVRALAQHPTVQHSLALARYAQGDFKGAAQAESMASDLVSLAPELSAEIDAAGYLMQKRAQAATAEEDVLDEEIEEQHIEAAVGFRERSPFEVMTWPPALRAEINALKLPE